MQFFEVHVFPEMQQGHYRVSSMLFVACSLPPSQSLESVTYEVALNLHRQSEYTTRLLLVLMSTVAKISSRCQDLIPRALLCLNKIVQFSSVSWPM